MERAKLSPGLIPVPLSEVEGGKLKTAWLWRVELNASKVKAGQLFYKSPGLIIRLPTALAAATATLER